MRRAVIVLVLAGCSSAHPYVPGPFDLDAVTRACVMQLSCLNPPLFTPGGNCVSQLEMALATSSGFPTLSVTDVQRFVDCAKTANSCKTLLDCASQHHEPSFCQGYVAVCDGELAIQCLGGGWGLGITDCAALGETCASVPAAAGCTSGASCLQPSTYCGDTVLDHVIVETDGSQLYSCNVALGFASVVDCGDLIAGGRCASETSDGTIIAACQPPTDGACAADGVTCTANFAIVCALGRRYVVDCSQLGGHCQLADSSFLCVPDATECSSTSPDQCAGDAIEICVNGRWSRTPCASFGLKTCVSDPSGTQCR